MKDVIREDIAAILCDRNIPWERLEGRDVLITGATGLLGSLLVRTLLVLTEEKGIHCRVHALVRSKEKAEMIFSEIHSDALDFIVSDIRKFFEYKGNIDYIVHAASETASRNFIECPVEVLETAICGTENILHLARGKGIKGMVFLSTMEVYGTPQTDERITEERTLEIRSQDVRSSYPSGKIACESLCVSYAKEYEVPVNVLRLTQTFGAGVDHNDSRVFAEFARCAMERKDIVLRTEGQTKRSYLYTSDAVRAILLLLLRDDVGNGQIFNAANEETYCSIAEMAQLVLNVCGNGEQTVRFEPEEKAEKFSYAPTLCMNLDTAKLRTLGWEPQIGLEEMYRRMCEGMR